MSTTKRHNYFISTDDLTCVAIFVFPHTDTKIKLAGKIIHRIMICKCCLSLAYKDSFVNFIIKFTFTRPNFD